MMYTICLVEDEVDLANLIKTYLEKAGYNVVSFTKGSEAINYIGNDVNLWILDIMLGDDVNGYDIIKAIREKDEEVPVIFTSARDQDLDKILGLELGSDDYITKPYSSKELVLRVNKIIKRVYKDENTSTLNYEDYAIDLTKRMVFENGKEIKLTTLEFDLLILFLKNKDKLSKYKNNDEDPYGYDFVPTISHVTNIDEQKQEVKRLENIKKDRKSTNNSETIH